MKNYRKIIDTYKPQKGFVDLSIKPISLSMIEYAKILNLQNYLAEQNEKAEYLKTYAHIQWEQLKLMSCDLQQVILEHWELENLG